MKNSVKIILLMLLALALIFIAVRTFSPEDTWVCENGQWYPHGKPSSPKPTSACPAVSCSQDAECETPMEFLVQSNCPFGSACLNSECKVVCPVFEATCQSNEDCDCSGRGPRSKECVCHEGTCLSVEA